MCPRVVRGIVVNVLKIKECKYHQHKDCVGEGPCHSEIVRVSNGIREVGNKQLFFGNRCEACSRENNRLSMDAKKVKAREAKDLKNNLEQTFKRLSFEKNGIPYDLPNLISNMPVPNLTGIPKVQVDLPIPTTASIDQQFMPYITSRNFNIMPIITATSNGIPPITGLPPLPNYIPQTPSRLRVITDVKKDDEEGPEGEVEEEIKE